MGWPTREPRTATIPAVSTIATVRPSVVGSPHRHVGPDVEHEPPRTIAIPRGPARFDSLIRAITMGSGVLMAVGLLAAQVLGSGG